MLAISEGSDTNSQTELNLKQFFKPFPFLGNDRNILLAQFLFKKAFDSNLKHIDFDSMLSECKKTNKKYTDREFPPNESSLIRGNRMKKQDRKWKKNNMEKSRRLS